MKAIEDVTEDLRKSWEDVLTFDKLHIPLDPIQNPPYTTVIWNLEAKQIGIFAGIGPVTVIRETAGSDGKVITENVPLTLHIHGISIVNDPSSGDSPPSLHTVIDWNEVFIQLGVPSHQRSFAGLTEAPPLEPAKPPEK